MARIGVLLILTISYEIKPLNYDSVHHEHPITILHGGMLSPHPCSIHRYFGSVHSPKIRNFRVLSEAPASSGCLCQEEKASTR